MCSIHLEFLEFITHATATSLWWFLTLTNWSVLSVWTLL